MSQRSPKSQRATRNPGKDLSRGEHLLIGLGAAVAAGCLPCSGHYIEKARQAELHAEAVSDAVAIGLAVRRRAVDEMASRVKRKMSREAPPPEDLTPGLVRSLETLVGLGAAYAANSPPLVRRSVRALRRKGISDEHMILAVGAARKPKGMAAKISDREVDGALGSATAGPNEEAGCCSQPCATNLEGAATEQPPGSSAE